MKTLSISDDDLCATCKFCQYDPGKESTCEKDWPAIKFGGVFEDYVLVCSEFEEKNS
ncbi:MAG: hypothetical protein FMNOHCHN_02565 [Ignavibacteriaceae bacterium]|nr:hypothetical protein [Ignavibacteriaceae bacterium]